MHSQDTQPEKQTRPVVTLKEGREQSLLRFHRWIFSRAIAHKPSNLAIGSLVDIHDYKGAILGTGTWEGGNIAVRMLQFQRAIEDERDFFREQLTKALNLRIALDLVRDNQTDDKTRDTIFRLVYGEADGLAGLIVDIYGDTAVIQAHSTGIYLRIELITELLLALPTLKLKAVYDKSSTTIPSPQIDFCGDRYLVGKRSNDFPYENGLQFAIDLEKGQKTGFFIDQRENRQLVESFAKGRSVLNCFCYTGGFSLYALRGEACQVASLDSSARALAITEENVKRNFAEETQAKHRTINADAFDYLASLEGHEYDLIILDPPAFAKNRSSIRNALNGYRRLNALALSKLAPSGLLFTFSCSQLVSPYDFRMAILTAAVDSGRSVRILHQLYQAPCHPVSIYHPENEYLKGLLLYVE